MQTGRSRRRADEEDKETVVEARAVDPHQAQGDERKAEVLQEHKCRAVQESLEHINIRSAQLLIIL